MYNDERQSLSYFKSNFVQYFEVNELKLLLERMVQDATPRGANIKIEIHRELFAYLMVVLELRVRQLMKQAVLVTPKIRRPLRFAVDNSYAPNETIFNGLQQLRYLLQNLPEFRDHKLRINFLVNTEFFYTLVYQFFLFKPQFINELKEHNERGAPLVSNEVRTLFNFVATLARFVPDTGNSIILDVDIQRVLTIEAKLGKIVPLTVTMCTGNLDELRQTAAPVFFPIIPYPMKSK